MLRIPLTSTDLIFLPTTSFSRSRRTTSTSGSSGIRSPHRGSCPGAVGWRSLARRSLCSKSSRCFTCVCLVGPLQAQPTPRGARRRLLGLLLRSALTPTPRFAADQHGGEEPLGVIRAFVRDLVARQLLEPLCRELLEARLVVVTAGSTGRVRDAFAEELHHDAPGRLETAVEVDGRDDRLQRVR